jgi:FtsP/CotA-like multicopper oxidase with cupredoxin domain
LSYRRSLDDGGHVHYCYVAPDGSEAPTLRLRPGDLLRLRLRNDEPAQAMPDLPEGCTAGGMGPTATNLHFHGLALPPVCHQDDVLHTFVQPGDAPFDYTVRIPADASPGVYWYHPHVHGYSNVQVLGGASGALIVEGIERVQPALAGLGERILVIRDQDLLNPDAEPKRTDSMPAPMVMRDAEGDILNTGTGGGKPAKDLSLNFVPVAYPDYEPAVLHMPPGQRELWRILNASAITYLDLQLLIDNRIQPLGLVSIDGVPIVGAEAAATVLWQSHVLLPPAGRVDMIIRGPAAVARASLVTRTVDTGPAGENDPTRPLATVLADAAAEPAARLPAPAAAKLPAMPRRAWLGTTNPVRTRHLFFSEQPRDPHDPAGPVDFFITQEGQPTRLFDPANSTPQIEVHSGDVEDWVIENRTRELHAFHIHQIHFLLLDWNGVPINEPYLRDTVNVAYWDGRSAQYPSVRLRMDFRDPQIVGTFVYHCHLLEHEDGGMMGLIRVLPKTAGHTASFRHRVVTAQ